MVSKYDELLKAYRQLQDEHLELKRSYTEVQETIAAIQRGDVDALVTYGPEGERIFTMETAERPYRLMVEAMQQGAGILDPAGGGTVLFGNQSLALILGLETSQLVGKSLLSFVHLDDRDLFSELLTHSRGAASSGEIRFLSSANETTETEVSFVAMPNDHAAVSMVVTDLTERKHIEKIKAADAALRASEERFRGLAENIPQLAWMADRDGRIFWYNQRWFEYTGMSPEQIHGWDWRHVQHPEHVERVTRRIRESFKDGLEWEDTFPLLSKSGEYNWFLSRAFPIRDETGEVLRWFGTHTDISEQLRKNEELRALTAQLSEESRRKSEFLATLAHELRNPLAPITSALELLKAMGDDKIMLERARQVMDRQTRQLVRLVDDLLNLSRISRGQVELRKQRVAMQDVVQSAVESSQPLIDKVKHTLIFDGPDTPLYIDADPNRLAQIFSNLLNNAAKYTPDGGTIRFSYHQDGDHVVVSVKDSGIGIPPESLDTIFDMFTQVKSETLVGFQGLGIGLALVKALVQQHNGEVKAFSAGIGQGSEFVVRLPLVAADRKEIASPQRRKPERGEALCVLVVDDNRDAATMLAMLVRQFGHEVHLAHDGNEGVSRAERLRPNLILMDIGMPVMNGFEAARAIRDKDWGSRIILAALTGWAQQEDKEKTKAAGFDVHLVKPVGLDDLQNLLESVVPAKSQELIDQEIKN